MAKAKERELWKWFSLFIRLRDSVNGWGECITCGHPVYFRDGDAGHFIPQQNHYATVYNPFNVHLQCRECNHIKSGDVERYREVLINKYGLDTVVKLERDSRVITKNMPAYLVKENATYYKSLALQEASRNGVEIG